jgi:HD-GYP domain-containing protein (c-di-GMP phosphodiesterase class II)
METKISNYLSIIERITREIVGIKDPEEIPPYVSKHISRGIGDEVQYAFIDLDANKVFESAVLDDTVQKILPYFLQPKFVEEVNKLDWSVIDQRGIRFLFDKIGGHNFDFNSTFLIIPKKKGRDITHFSILWASDILGEIDKEEVDFLSTVCSTVVLRMSSLLAKRQTRKSEDQELRRKAFELKEITRVGNDLASLGKEDFFGSILLNVMGRALSKTAVIFLSMNENNTEYSIAASRGLEKREIYKGNISEKFMFIQELRRKKSHIFVSDIEEVLAGEEKDILTQLETEALVPLLLKNEVVGVLALGERINLQPYTQKVIDSIHNISQQMVMAIEASKLSNLRYAFSRYVSHQLVEGILSDPDQLKLGGERRKITVLFADIRGFTTMAEKMRPEEVVDLLNTFLSGLTDVVFKYEGTLDKYMGDCVMAVFGAPFSHYNDTERAVFCAVEMQEYIEAINEKREKEGLERVEIGVGINTGFVISGNMGSVKRMDYTVIGDVVNTASRLEGQAVKGQILVTKEVYDEVKYLVEADYLTSLTVKGREQQIEVFEIKEMIARKYLRVVEKREPYITGHFLNVAQDVEAVGLNLGMSGEDLTKLRSSAMLIDVGRIGINESVFNKKEKLTPEEFELIKSHVLRGAEYVDKKLHLFKEGVELVMHHHEFWDGSGYPDGLKGEEIPLWARIVCIVDNYNALISERPFRKPFAPEKAMEIMREGSGKKYDPRILDIYMEIIESRIHDKVKKDA